METSSLEHPTKDRVKPPTKRRPSKDLLNANRRESVLKSQEIFPDHDGGSSHCMYETDGWPVERQQRNNKSTTPVPQKPQRSKQNHENVNYGTNNATVIHRNMQAGDDNASTTRMEISIDDESSTTDAAASNGYSSDIMSFRRNMQTEKKLPGYADNKYKPLSFTERLKASSLSSTNDYSRKFSPGGSIAARLNASTITPAKRNSKAAKPPGSVSIPTSCTSQDNQRAPSLSSRNNGFPPQVGILKGSMKVKEQDRLSNSKEELKTCEKVISRNDSGKLSSLNNVFPANKEGESLPTEEKECNRQIQSETYFENVGTLASITVHREKLDDNLSKSIDFSLPPLSSLDPLATDSGLGTYGSENLDMVTLSEETLHSEGSSLDTDSEKLQEKDIMVPILKLPDPPLPDPPLLNPNVDENRHSSTLDCANLSSTDSDLSATDFSNYSPTGPKYGSLLTVEKKVPPKSNKRKQSDGLSLPVIPPLEFPGKELNDYDITQQFKLVPPPPPDFESDNDNDDVIDPPTLYDDPSSDNASDCGSNVGVSDLELDLDDPIQRSSTNSMNILEKPLSTFDEDDLEPKSIPGEVKTSPELLDTGKGPFELREDTISVEHLSEVSSPPYSKDAMESTDLNNEKIDSVALEAQSKSNDRVLDMYSRNNVMASAGVGERKLDLFTELGIEKGAEHAHDSDSDDYSAPSTEALSKEDFPIKVSAAPSQWSSFSSSSSYEFGRRENKVNFREILRNHSKVIDQDSENEEQENKVKSTVVMVSPRDDDEYQDKEENFECLEDRLSRYPVEEWSVTDVGDWLEITGISDLRRIFEERRINGRKLLEIDMQLLDEMQISDPEDREMILSEIYALKNPDEGDFEVSLLDALDNTSGLEHEKLLALLDAFKTPENQTFTQSYLPSSPSPVVSPRDEDFIDKPPKLVKTKAATIESRSVALRERSISQEMGPSKREDKRPPRPKSELSLAEAQKQLKLDRKPSTSSVVEDGKEDKKGKKSSKRRKFLPDAFSFRRKKASKLSKIFKSTKLSDPSFKAFLQSGPQGIVRITTDGVVDGNQFTTLMVTINTTVQDVVQALCDKIQDAADERIFYLAQCQTDKTSLVPDIELKGDDCPLLLQCRWPDVERYYFHLRKRPFESIQVSFEDNSILVDIAPFTTAKDVIHLILRRQHKIADVDEYHLVFQDDEGYDPAMSPEMTLLNLPHREGMTLAFHLLKFDIPDKQSEGSTTFLDKDSKEITELEKTVTTLQNEVSLLQSEIRTEKEKVASEKMNAEAFYDRNQFLEEMVKVKEGEVHKLKEELEEMKSGSNLDRQKFNEVVLEKKKLRALFDELNEKAEELEDENEKMKRDSGHWKKIAVSQDKLMQDIEPVKEENECLKSKIKNYEAQIERLQEEKLQVNRDDSTVVEELQTQANVLQQLILDKDSKLLEIEFAVQRKERELVEAREAHEDMKRNADKANIAVNDAEERNKDLSKKIDNLKRLVMEKDKQIQAFKLTQGKLDESSKEELRRVKLQVTEKETLIQNLKQELEDVKSESNERIETLQELVTDKDVAVRETEMKLNKQNEDVRLTADLLERKIGTKDQVIKKLEDKVSKLETMTRENLKKFEKFMSDKDRMMKQVKADSEKDIEALKSRLHRAEDINSEKEKQIRELQRISNASKDRNEFRLQKIEDENKQQKFLLERLLGIVSTRDPRILKEFEESFEELDTVDDKEPLIQKEDEWC